MHEIILQRKLAVAIVNFVIKLFNVDRDLLLFRLRSASQFFEQRIAAVSQPLQLEIREDSAGADDLVVRDVDVVNACRGFEKPGRDLNCKDH